MNLTPRWVQALAGAGHEALHWSEAGNSMASDTEICTFAREHEYVVLTNDLDFPQILVHTRQAGPSVVLLRSEPLTPETRGLALLQALQDCASELILGAIVSLDWSGPTTRQGPPTRYLAINAHRSAKRLVASMPFSARKRTTRVRLHTNQKFHATASGTSIFDAPRGIR
jgi:predicted nuclease of predicted toxin-antitoxin system